GRIPKPGAAGLGRAEEAGEARCGHGLARVRARLVPARDGRPDDVADECGCRLSHRAAIISARLAHPAPPDLDCESATTWRPGMHANGSGAQWFAERSIRGVGDDGAAEVVTIWIERKPGAIWAVGRAVGLAERHDGLVRPDDYVFEGYEMGDALEEGKPQEIEPFSEGELLIPLERWFFGRCPRAERR